MRLWISAVVVLAACPLVAGSLACTKPGNTCESDEDCTDPAYPFCDVNGEYAESGNRKNTCSITPTNCPVERCGCVPGEARCDSDQLVTCNADGQSVTMATCSLGCASAERRCLTFDPLNGLSSALGEAAAEPDISFPTDIRVDSSTGVISNTSGNVIAVKTQLVGQGNSSIRVFVARSFVIENATITGANAVAFVSLGPVSIKGRVDVRAQSLVAGPGAQEPPAGCVGASSDQNGSGPGGGGGGNGTPGGKGGGAFTSTMGGTAVQAFEPLVGGCRGGKVNDLANNVVIQGGGGGGALQIVSLQEIAFAAAGLVNAGGGGGSFAGAGSGGLVILEAPRVHFDGDSTGIAANGGAGGGCGLGGPDANANASPALAPSSCSSPGGNGGTGAITAADAYICNPPPPFACSITAYAGGGGAAGRVRIATSTGTFEQNGSPVISAVVTAAKLTAK